MKVEDIIIAIANEIRGVKLVYDCTVSRTPTWIMHYGGCDKIRLAFYPKRNMLHIRITYGYYDDDAYLRNENDYHPVSAQTSYAIKTFTPKKLKDFINSKGVLKDFERCPNVTRRNMAESYMAMICKKNIYGVYLIVNNKLEEF